MPPEHLKEEIKERALRDLISGCRRQDRRAQTSFYEFYKKKLYGVCLRYAGGKDEADDIFQEAFIRIFRHIADLKDPAGVHGWVRSTVIRTAINYYHRELKPLKELVSLESVNLEIGNDHYDRIIGQLQMESLLDMINQLPEGYRLIINLYLIDGYSHTEIAALLDISAGTSRSQLARGKAALCKKLQQTGLIPNETIRQS